MQEYFGLSVDCGPVASRAPPRSLAVLLLVESSYLLSLKQSWRAVSGCVARVMHLSKAQHIIKDPVTDPTGS